MGCHNSVNVPVNCLPNGTRTQEVYPNTQELTSWSGKIYPVSTRVKCSECEGTGKDKKCSLNHWHWVRSCKFNDCGRCDGTRKVENTGLVLHELIGVKPFSCS